MGSSGGGSSKPPNQPTPAGQITGYGSASAFNPSFNSVLSDNMGWADVDEIDSANAANAQAAAARAAAPPPPQMGGMGGMGDMNAFAQQLMDYQKNQQFNQRMMGMGPQGMAYAMSHGGPFGGQAPTPQGPAQQLMMQALQQRQTAAAAPAACSHREVI